MTTRYEGVGDTIEAALDQAHMQIPVPKDSDFTVSRVVDWGMQFGGFTQKRSFYVVVEQDPGAPVRTGGETATP